MNFRSDFAEANDVLDKYYRDNELHVDEMTNEEFSDFFGFNRSGEPGNYTYSPLDPSDSIDGIGAYDDDFLRVPDEFITKDLGENPTDKELAAADEVRKLYDNMTLVARMSDTKYTGSLTSDEFNTLASNYVEMMSTHCMSMFNEHGIMLSVDDAQLANMSDDDVERLVITSSVFQSGFDSAAKDVDLFTADMQEINEQRIADLNQMISDSPEYDAPIEIFGDTNAPQEDQPEQSEQAEQSEQVETGGIFGVWNKVKSTAVTLFSKAGSWITASAVGGWVSNKLKSVVGIGKSESDKYLDTLVKKYGADQILQQLSDGEGRTTRDIIDVDEAKFDNGLELGS